MAQRAAYAAVGLRQLTCSATLCMTWRICPPVKVISPTCLPDPWERYNKCDGHELNDLSRHSSPIFQKLHSISQMHHAQLYSTQTAEKGHVLHTVELHRKQLTIASTLTVSMHFFFQYPAKKQAFTLHITPGPACH